MDPQGGQTNVVGDETMMLRPIFSSPLSTKKKSKKECVGGMTFTLIKLLELCFFSALLLVLALFMS
jgi:hypothetical protein